MASPFVARRVIWIVAILVAAGAWLLMRGGSGERPPDGSAGSQRVTPPKRGTGAPGNDPEVAAKSSPRPAGDPGADSVEDHAEALSEAGGAEAAREALGRLDAWLRGLPPGEAARVVRDFMTSGRDVSLPLDFRIGEGGFLEAPPTLRVALLDLLARLDPEAAAALGKEILSTPTSADEWALALRNVARLDDDGSERAYLLAKTEELIRNESWQASPSIGYLNAFDVLVHTGATESTPLLSELIQRKDRRDLAHAGFLTLDRLTQREPLEILGQLKDDEALGQSRPEMVAQQFARADLREPDQRALVRAWLLDEARREDELRAFAGVFPNNNRLVSRNLLTTESPPSGAQLRAHDAAVLGLVSQWREDPAFEKRRPHLDTMIARLEEFTGSRGPAPAPEAP